ncbi:hypothetical protein J2X97_002254 [Epilithonimonas hungarica]|uniref:hypothetical protein n=1 Tax=Epilithonimonas hungarica TaxID=454006 RepID=UPI002785B34D|nr:hypothetical protein [Epilithonimonas hungarica]MDP9956595.1 hypothetical protein [Epilithonimonas hungarica]
MKKTESSKSLESLEKFQIKKNSKKVIHAGSQMPTPYGGLGTCICSGGCTTATDGQTYWPQSGTWWPD